VTLSTNVYVLDEVDPREVFRFCQGLLAKYDEDRRPPERQVWSDEASSTYRDSDDQNGVRRIANRLGQDLPGILDITYRAGGALRAEPPGHDEDCGEDCGGEYHSRVCWLDIDFDTAYGYKDERGWGCGDLHAALVNELGQWLDAKGARWEWRNEFTSEVHGGGDRYERLIDLCSGGFEATAWFRTSVLPAIAIGLLDKESDR
jgi:hypothetical protein